MSRYSDYDDDEDFPGQWELYGANLRRAMRGKRGRKFLADLREALLALPEPKLIGGALCTVGAEKRRAELAAEAGRDWLASDPQWRTPRPDTWYVQELDEQVQRDGEGVCAIGAYLWHQKVKAGADPQEAFESLPLILGTSDGGLGETAALAVQQGHVAQMVAWQVAYRNDEDFERKSPQERHAAFIEWIDKQLEASAA